MDIKKLFSIEIGKRNMLFYLLLPHHIKHHLLTDDSKLRLEEINNRYNNIIYSGNSAKEYNVLHCYDEGLHHEYPAKILIEEAAKNNRFETVVEIGAGSGYFTEQIAKYAKNVIAVEPVLDFQNIIKMRCKEKNIQNITVLGESILNILEHIPESSVDAVFVIHALHHLHRRKDVFRIIKRMLRPGGKLFLVEPHHNAERAISLILKYLKTYKYEQFYKVEDNWATHDFLTRRELKKLSKDIGFKGVKICSYRIILIRRISSDIKKRFGLESVLGRTPFLSHFGKVLYFEACK